MELAFVDDSNSNDSSNITGDESKFKCLLMWLIKGVSIRTLDF